jgi:golgi-specific brefeldin A-resistance guanine nucleotide exchange factor 1
VSENLKNILLVMANGDYLAPPNEKSSPQQEEVWMETWKRLDRFLPQLYGELFPEEAKKGPPTSFTREKKDSAASEAPEKAQEPEAKEDGEAES